jgi:hypothetical protein
MDANGRWQKFAEEIDFAPELCAPALKLAWHVVWTKSSGMYKPQAQYHNAPMAVAAFSHISQSTNTNLMNPHKSPGTQHQSNNILQLLLEIPVAT